MRCHRLLLPLSLCVFLLGFGARSAHAQAEIISGTIRGPDKKPIEGADVTVTYYDGSLSRQARTDKNGLFRVAFTDGSGDYWVSVAAIGYLAKRFEVKRLGDEDILIADANITKQSNTLQAVHVTASRQRPARTDTSDIGGSTRTVSADALTLDQMGDLSAMAATLPGVTYIPGADGAPSSFAVLGLDASQNQSLLDGSQTSAANLPRDADVSTSVVVSQYDVSQGGAAGGTLQVQTRGGTNFYARRVSSQTYTPGMQWTSPAADALGLKNTYGDFSGTVSGPITFNKILYNASLQVSRSQHPLQDLLNTSPLGLETAGIAADSVARLQALLLQDGIPTTVGRLPGSSGTTSGLFLSRLDFAPPSPTSGQQFALTLQANTNVTDPVQASATAFPSYTGTTSRQTGTVVLRGTDYLGCCVLSETNIGLGGTRVSSAPYAAMPAGNVLVSSTFADGTPGTTAALRFGGSPSLNTASTTSQLTFRNLLSWFSADNKNRIKFTTEAGEDAFWQNATTNQLGTFSYQSLADLENNTPASFTRTLSPRILSGNQTRLATSLGDAWRPTTDFQLQYGLRVDANRFNSPPAFDQSFDQTFGLRTDGVPDHVYASPRVGFSWTYGSAQQIAGVVGAARTPRAVVRGGLGVFQNMGNASLIQAAQNATGLPGSTQQLTCVGTAVPTPDWNGYDASSASIPTQCADGTTGTAFASSAPGVVVFDPKYQQPRSVRGNLQWNGAVLNNIFFTRVDYTQSLNLNQPEFANINFVPDTRFTLANELNRPVYANAADIVPTTGAVAPGDALLSPAFSTVRELRSDGMSDSRQIQIGLSPVQYHATYSWNVTYVRLDQSQYGNGFSLNTDGNPFDKSWARSSNDYHNQITWGLGYKLANTVTFNLNGRFQSGGAYTPIVLGDINGDGYSNDRAFVFDPAHTQDPTLAAGMQTLLASAPANARSCLEKQLGQIAARNTCEQPWLATSGLSVRFNSLMLHLPQRSTISLSINNLPEGADLMLHGDNHLHGWGNQIVDPHLLTVTGFNQSTDAFVYQVNPRFGSAISTPLSPVLLTLQIGIDVGTPRERQTLTQMLDRGRATPGLKASASLIKGQYSGGGVTNPMAMLLRESDSLKLTTDQADTIAAYNRYFTTRLDSIWTPIADKLAALPDKYNQNDAYALYRYGREQSFDLLIAIGPRIDALLTPQQRRMLPPALAPLLDPKYLATVRSSTSAGSGIGAIIR